MKMNSFQILHICSYQPFGTPVFPARHWLGDENVSYLIYLQASK